MSFFGEAFNFSEYSAGQKGNYLGHVANMFGNAVIAHNLRAIQNELAGTRRDIKKLNRDMNRGFEKIANQLVALNQSFSHLLLEVGHCRDSLEELTRIASSPAKTAAYEHFEIARDAFRQELYADSLEEVNRAINGGQGSPGYKLEWRFHYLKGTIQLGFVGCDTDVIDLDEARDAFEAAARYAKSDFPEESARALQQAGWAAYCDHDFDRAIQLTEEVFKTFGDPNLHSLPEPIATHLPNVKFQLCKICYSADKPGRAPLTSLFLYSDWAFIERCRSDAAFTVPDRRAKTVDKEIEDTFASLLSAVERSFDEFKKEWNSQPRPPRRIYGGFETLLLDVWSLLFVRNNYGNSQWDIRITSLLDRLVKSISRGIIHEVFKEEIQTHGAASHFITGILAILKASWLKHPSGFHSHILSAAVDPLSRCLVDEPQNQSDPRDTVGPFLMAVKDVSSLEGSGTVATGTIERGTIRVGDKIQLIGLHGPVKTTCTGVEMFRTSLTEGQAGDSVGLLLQGIQDGEIQPGHVLAAGKGGHPHAEAISQMGAKEREIYFDFTADQYSREERELLLQKYPALSYPEAAASGHSMTVRKQSKEDQFISLVKHIQNRVTSPVSTRRIPFKYLALLDNETDGEEPPEQLTVFQFDGAEVYNIKKSFGFSDAEAYPDDPELLKLSQMEWDDYLESGGQEYAIWESRTGESHHPFVKEPGLFFVVDPSGDPVAGPYVSLDDAKQDMLNHEIRREWNKGKKLKTLLPRKVCSIDEILKEIRQQATLLDPEADGVQMEITRNVKPSNHEKPSEKKSETLYDILLDALCCVMVADGNASRNEKTAILGIMKKVKAPHSDEDVNRAIMSFIKEIKERGFTPLLKTTLKRAREFKKRGKQKILLQALAMVSKSDGSVDDAERKMIDRFKAIVQ